MATLAEVEQHRSAVEDVATLAVAEMVAEWPSLPEDPLALTSPLAELLEALIADFGEMTATLGADFYEELRLQADAPGSFNAVLAEPIPVEQIQASASWAASAAWLDDDKALRDASAFLDRALASQDRATIDANVGRDPAQPRYARYASANACAFCALNATRGPVYRSEDAAAGKYHDHCRCIAVPSWTRSDYTEAPYVAEWREAYFAATESGARDTKAVLAHMRTAAGLR